MFLRGGTKVSLAFPRPNLESNSFQRVSLVHLLATRLFASKAYLVLPLDLPLIFYRVLQKIVGGVFLRYFGAPGSWLIDPL
jgi:hypothetical protein